MRKLPLLIAAGLAACSADAQVSATIDTAAMNTGFAAFYELGTTLPAAPIFGQPWGVPELTGVAVSPTVAQMGATQVGNGDSFWIVGGTGSAAPGDWPAAGSDYQGDKISEATWYAEISDGSAAGQSFTFSADITAFDLDPDYSAYLVIKESGNGFTPITTPITGTGITSVTVPEISSGAGNLVQYGLYMIGPNVVPGDQFRYGSVTAAAVPEPGVFALLGGLGALGFVLYRRRK